MKPETLRRAAAVLALVWAAALGAPLRPGGAHGPGRAAAQETPRHEPLSAVADLPVERVGRSDVAIDRRLARLLESDPLILAGDTLIAAGDTVFGPVLVLDATLILEGVVTGDLVIVDAGAFVRPRSVVGGDLVNAGGGLYRSEVARVGGAILDLPVAEYRVVREPDRLVIRAAGGPSLLVLDGVAGFHPPSYDRVNGVTGVWGATLRPPPLGPIGPALHAQAGWLTERGDPTYAADLSVRWGATTLAGGYEDGWDTNERWIRSDLRNSLNYIWDGDDYRDYHGVERVWAGVEQAFGDQEKRFHGVLGVRAWREDASTLPGGEPWHLLSGTVRPNRVIDDGRIASVVARFDAEWHGLRTDFEGGIGYEAARRTAGGEFEFDRLTAAGEWAMQGLANHTLEIEFFAQAPLGGGTLPRQRWSFVGGSGTLQTLGFAEFYGDHVVFVESKYIIPFPERVALPVIGAPVLELIHAAGMAWTDEARRDLHQEVGARLTLFAFFVRYMVAPGSDRDPDLDLGLRWPFDLSSFPWER